MKTLFQSTLLLLALLLPVTATAYDFEVNGIYYNINGNNVTVTYSGTGSKYSGDVTIPATVIYDGTTYSVTSIDNYAFQSCCDLSSITIPSSVTSISYHAFYGCTSLTKVNIEDIAAWCKIDFGDCYSEYGANPLYYAHHLYMNDEEITDLIIPNFVTGIDAVAFNGCSGLTSITIPSSVTSIGPLAFSGCTGLAKVNIEDLTAWCKIEFWDDEANPLCYAHHLYMNNEEISDLIIPNSVTYIGHYAFEGCSGLTSIIIPNSVTGIGAYAFSKCSGLTSVTIPNSVTDIFGGAFSYCSSLTSITIPNSIYNIGYVYNEEAGIYGNYNLNTIFLTGEGYWTGGDCVELPRVATLYIDKGITGLRNLWEEPDDVFSFAVTPPSCEDDTFTNYTGTLHVPAASLAAYFTAPYWCNFANIVGDAVKPNGLSLDKDGLELILPETATLATTISPATATSNIINWASSNPAVATVVNGQVTAVGLGECDIVALCADQKAVCHIVVYNDRISVDQLEAQLLPNHMVTLTPTSLAATLPALTVTSSDPTVAAARVMNGKVQIVGVTEGTATITVASADGSAKPATCLVTVYTEMGDANGDGFIDIDDVTSLIERVLGNDVPTFKDKNGDMNGDGILDIDDITALINTILGTT